MVVTISDVACLVQGDHGDHGDQDVQGVRGVRVGDLGTSEEEDRNQQVPHYVQCDPHPNQDYPSFASYLAPFSYHQAFVVSLDLLEIP